MNGRRRSGLRRDSFFFCWRHFPLIRTAPGPICTFSHDDSGRSDCYHPSESSSSARPSLMARTGPPSPTLPLGALLTQFRACRPGCPPSPVVIPEHWERLSDEEFGNELLRLAARVLPVVFHGPVFVSRARFLRHALVHLWYGQDPLPRRLARCVTPGETYHVPGVGPAFWAAVVRSLDPDLPVWSPAVEAGLVRLGLWSATGTGMEERFTAVCAGLARVRAVAADLSAEQACHFLARVGRMTGRELPSHTEPEAFSWSAGAEAVRRAVREVRTRTPLRARLRQTPPERLEAVRRFVAESRDGDAESAWAAFTTAWPDRSWETALPALDDAYDPALPAGDRAVLWCQTAAVLRDTFRVHPLELADVVQAVAGLEPAPGPIGGPVFCRDTFAFLHELTACNRRDWMAAHRDRYHFVLRDPLVELCREVAERYIRPVLGGEYGWELEYDPRPGRALTRICRNDFGRGDPYQTLLWITFYRRDRAERRADAQLFVRVGAEGVRYGFHLGRSARRAAGLFRKAVQDHGEWLWQALEPGRMLQDYHFWAGDELTETVAVRSAADLRAWAAHKTLAAGVHRAPTDAILRGPELAGDVLLTFDRLLPLFACAVETDPRPLLLRRTGSPDVRPVYDSACFRRDTYLSEAWLDRVLGLLRLKRQLVLQGPPGTGKTHVARCLARLLTGDHPDRVRMVQFHPAYSYEEFVEGIRVRTSGGEVSYPVEDGVLGEFAARATAHPAEPHVLIIDELNRGNLPRIFGELLFLLEYRQQAVTLPYSKRSFRLPDNLYILATLNPLDHSAVALDQALRRRFSFVDMPADAAILARWLEDHPPADDETFGSRVVRLFEELNARLARDLGPGRQVGHSFFMVPGLNRESFAAVWEHHVRPVLLDYLGGHSDRLRDYEPARLLREPRTVRLV